MKKAVIYIHGQGGSAAEAEHYRPLFPEADVIGFDYTADTPWAAKAEFPLFFEAIASRYDTVSIIANSIGAYFAMTALSESPIEKAYLISPVVDMERLICDMMSWAGVSEETLREQGEIQTDLGQALSWEYLSYVRLHPIRWCTPASILYGSEDNLTPYSAVKEFAEKAQATLTVMEGGEHWFHTEAQMAFLDGWIKSTSA